MQLKWVTAKTFAQLSGYTEEAVRAKIKKSVWAYKVHYRKAPDGRILINLEEVEKWIESTPA